MGVEKPSNESNRDKIRELFPTDSAFMAFCLDYFATVHREFTDLMDREARESSLIAKTDPKELNNALERWRKKNAERYRVSNESLREQIAIQPAAPTASVTPSNGSNKRTILAVTLLSIFSITTLAYATYWRTLFFKQIESDKGIIENWQGVASEYASYVAKDNRKDEEMMRAAGKIRQKMTELEGEKESWQTAIQAACKDMKTIAACEQEKQTIMNSDRRRYNEAINGAMKKYRFCVERKNNGRVEFTPTRTDIADCQKNMPTWLRELDQILISTKGF